MKKATQILDLPVMGIKEGTQKGIVRDLIIDTRTKAIEYLIVQEGRKYNPFLLDMRDVVGVGEQYIVVKSTEDLKKVYGGKEYMETAATGFYLMGAAVLSDEGNVMGKVSDFEADPKTGAIDKIFLDNGSSYDDGQIVALSNDLVFVGDGGSAEQEEPVMPKVPEPAAASVETESRNFLIGQTVQDDVESDDGEFKVAAGTVLTEELIAQAEAHDAIPLLIVNID